MSHAEETSLVAEGVMNEGHRSAMLGMKGRPTVAEDIAVMREILLAEYADAWVHISHISSKMQLIWFVKLKTWCESYSRSNTSSFNYD